MSRRLPDRRGKIMLIIIKLKRKTRIIEFIIISVSVTS